MQHRELPIASESFSQSDALQLRAYMAFTLYRILDETNNEPFSIIQNGDQLSYESINSIFESLQLPMLDTTLMNVDNGTSIILPTTTFPSCTRISAKSARQSSERLLLRTAVEFELGTSGVLQFSDNIIVEADTHPKMVISSTSVSSAISIKDIFPPQTLNLLRLLKTALPTSEIPPTVKERRNVVLFDYDFDESDYGTSFLPFLPENIPNTLKTSSYAVEENRCMFLSLVNINFL